ncbi:MAG TPA: hypothetical protein VLG66_16760 [Alphaproteobacteria bacterium]|jgi:hypothetical protein|nr:hypothetical protein [Alphaproteobacteria bacterium]
MSAQAAKRHRSVTPEGGVCGYTPAVLQPASARDSPMVEIIVERWTNRDGSEEFLWSVWTDGRRIDMGGPLKDAAAAERAAQRYCKTQLGMVADRVTRL